MISRVATTYVDYQQRAAEFSVGDLAYPLASDGSTDESQAGRVVAVYPAIGQVDLEFPWGSGRYPVEEVQRVTDVAAKPPSVEHSTVPGGAGSVRVPGGPQGRTPKEACDRVSLAFVKQALYWASKDRHYRATKGECDSGRYACPKCKRNADLEETPYLRPANYKRVDGRSHRLLGCPHCLFLIKREHIIGDPAYDEHVHSDDEAGEAGEALADWGGSMEQGFESVRKVYARGSLHQRHFEQAGQLSKVDPALAKIIVQTGDRKNDKIRVSKKMISAAQLKPSQTTMVLAKSLGMALLMLKTNKVGGDLGALVSSDGFIMDGHHRWSASILAGGSSAKVGGYVAAMKGPDLLRVLNTLTVGEFGRRNGNPGTGNLGDYTPSKVSDMLTSFVEDGIRGKFPWSPDEVKETLERAFGSVEQGVDRISANASLVYKGVPSWAPARSDMPVINPGSEVGQAVKKMQRGEIDVAPPFHQAAEG